MSGRSNWVAPALHSPVIDSPREVERPDGASGRQRQSGRDDAGCKHSPCVAHGRQVAFLTYEPGSLNGRGTKSRVPAKEPHPQNLLDGLPLNVADHQPGHKS